MRTRGSGIRREDYYSLCSRHREWDETCVACSHGRWRNHWSRMGGSIVYKLFPWLWRWWVNRPNSASRKFLEETFPGLKREK